jgi:hypothetical protein
MLSEFPDFSCLSAALALSRLMCVACLELAQRKASLLISASLAVRELTPDAAQRHGPDA